MASSALSEISLRHQAAFPADAFHGRVGLQLGLRDRGAQRGDAQHAAAVGDHLAVDDGGAGVKHFHVRHFGRFVQAADRQQAFVVAGIALAGHHHADRRARIPTRRLDFVQPAIDRRFQQIEQVALQPHQDRLAFGIAEADVVLQHLGPLMREHQPGVEHALERPAGPLHGVDRGHQDLLFDPVQQFFGDDAGPGNRRPCRRCWARCRRRRPACDPGPAAG